MLQTVYKGTLRCKAFSLYCVCFGHERPPPMRAIAIDREMTALEQQFMPERQIDIPLGTAVQQIAERQNRRSSAELTRESCE